jgi:hypothetical protein
MGLFVINHNTTFIHITIKKNIAATYESLFSFSCAKKKSTNQTSKDEIKTAILKIPSLISHCLAQLDLDFRFRYDGNFIWVLIIVFIRIRFGRERQKWM